MFLIVSPQSSAPIAKYFTKGMRLIARTAPRAKILPAEQENTAGVSATISMPPRSAARARICGETTAGSAAQGFGLRYVVSVSAVERIVFAYNRYGIHKNIIAEKICFYKDFVDNILTR